MSKKTAKPKPQTKPKAQTTKKGAKPLTDDELSEVSGGALNAYRPATSTQTAFKVSKISE